MKKILFQFLFTFSSVAVFANSYDTVSTDLARFIAGMECETKFFRDLQSEDYYKQHREFCNTSWKELEDSTLHPMVKWAHDRNIIEASDTGTCFYPFSGPDYLFAEQFFPHCRDYILLGLERTGTMPDAWGLSQDQIKSYLHSIRESQRYLLKAGYFVTSHMSSDFSKTILNGNIHLMNYFLVRTGHVIISTEHGGISSPDGKFYAKGKQKGLIPGFRINFSRDSADIEKSVYYFSVDVADYKLKNQSGFRIFIESFRQLNTYIKSASYIPAHANFATMRDIILKNSHKILQDDTGVPLKSIDTTRFDLQMWGTYSKTIKDLSWGYQSELKKALENSGNNKSLPFRISYNGNYGEGMMMYMRRK